MTYQLVCGAEIHVELKTKSKMFCGCKNDPFGADKPNLYTCPVCLGLPGALPVPNRQAVEDCILIGLALNCSVATVSKFDRKHYFYPDLPKGYQISQYDEPFCTEGFVETSFGRVGITRVHMEEDTAKLQHATVAGEKVSLIDFNRSGVPLVEIVTEPDLKSAEQAKEFLKKVRDIIRALGVSDCDMEKGSMRLEANISLTSDGKLPQYKVEVKNINSFRFFANSIQSEITRQSAILESGKTPAQETRGWREKEGATVPQRSKEVAKDYRYFPEPDIPPFRLDAAWVDSIRSRLPVLPGEQTASLVSRGVPASAAVVLVANSRLFTFFKSVMSNPLAEKIDSLAKIAANDIVNKKIDPATAPADYLARLIAQKSALIADEAVLTPIIERLMAANPDIVRQYRDGKTGVLGFFVGQVKKETQGRADPQAASNLIMQLLK